MVETPVVFQQLFFHCCPDLPPKSFLQPWEHTVPWKLPELITWKTQKLNYGHGLFTDTIPYPHMASEDVVCGQALNPSELCCHPSTLHLCGFTRQHSPSKILIKPSTFGISTPKAAQAELGEFTTAECGTTFGGETKCFQLSAVPLSAEPGQSPPD